MNETGKIKVAHIISCKSITNSKGAPKITVKFLDPMGEEWNTKALHSVQTKTEIPIQFLTKPGRTRGRDRNKRKTRYDRNKYSPGYRTGTPYKDPDERSDDE